MAYTSILTKGDPPLPGGGGKLDLTISAATVQEINNKLALVAARIQKLDTAGSALLTGLSAGGWTIGATSLAGTSGSDIHVGQLSYDSGTGFWFGNAGDTAKFSIGNSSGNKLTWNGSALAITGSITASSGTIGGFTISATELFAGSGATRVEMQAAGGFWAGATTFAAAPFSVSPAGALTASSGNIGGWGIGATTLTGNAVTLDAGNGKITAGNVTIKNNEIDVGSAALTWIGSVLNVNTGLACGSFSSTSISTGAIGGTLLNVVGGSNPASGRVKATAYIDAADEQVVGARGAAVADSTDATNVATQLNLLLARLRAATGHGLIA